MQVAPAILAPLAPQDARSSTENRGSPWGLTGTPLVSLTHSASWRLGARSAASDPAVTPGICSHERLSPPHPSGSTPASWPCLWLLAPLPPPRLPQAPRAPPCPSRPGRTGLPRALSVAKPCCRRLWPHPGERSWCPGWVPGLREAPPPWCLSRQGLCVVLRQLGHGICWAEEAVRAWDMATPCSSRGRQDARSWLCLGCRDGTSLGIWAVHARSTARAGHHAVPHGSPKVSLSALGPGPGSRSAGV